MKSGLTLKFMLKATLACVLLTVVDLIFDLFQPVRIGSHRKFEMIAAWIALLIAWAIYLLEHLRKSKQDKEDA